MAQDTVDASNSHDPLEDLYNSIRTARFLEKIEDGFLFDIGLEQKAMVEAEEYSAGQEPSPGEQADLLVERPYGDYWAASRRKAEKLAIWDRLASLADSGEPVEGLIVAENKGGLSVDMGTEMSVRAFVPRSQIDIHRVDDCSPYVGRRERFRVIDFDTERGNVVLSRRVLLEEEREQSRGQLVEELEPGQVFAGVVRNVVDFGAFVDIGGIEGLLHASNMSWGRVDHPSELVRPGDELQVVVLDWKPDRKRLSLGRKQLLADPWENIGERYSDGDVVTGKVVSLADFGAFVELEPGLDGLVHVTELSWTQRINHPRDVLELGAEVRVKIIGIDPDNRRMSLSIKGLERNPWQEVADTLTPGSRISGPIVNVTDFGLFVEIVPGIDGLVHVSDLSWTEKIDDPRERYRVGQEVDVVVLDVDPETTRASLGIKQLEADPWQEVKAIAVPGKKIKVTISRLADFGAFAEIVPGVEGLIHISELAEDRVERVADVVRPGQEVEALVTSFDRANERIGLSLKRDRLGDDDEQKSYTDTEGATSTLGDIFRDRLGLAAPLSEEEAPEAARSPDAADVAPPPETETETEPDQEAEGQEEP